MNDLIHYHDFKHHLLSDLKWLEKNKGEWDEVIELDLKSTNGKRRKVIVQHEFFGHVSHQRILVSFTRKIITKIGSAKIKVSGK